MKKFFLFSIVLVLAFIILECGDNGGGFRLPTSPEPQAPACINDNVCFRLGDDGHIYLAWRIECYVKSEGKPVYNTEGTGAHLHGHILNPDGGHTYLADVISSAVITNGVAEFRFPNYGSQGKVRLRVWGSLGPFGMPGDEKWACVPAAGNSFYRVDCVGQPGLETYLYPDRHPTPVDPTEPCDPWSGRNDDYNY